MWEGQICEIDSPISYSDILCYFFLQIQLCVRFCMRENMWMLVYVHVCLHACLCTCTHSCVQRDRKKSDCEDACHIGQHHHLFLWSLQSASISILSSFWINFKSYNITNEFINLKNIYKVKLKLVLGSFPLKLSGFLPWFSPLLKIHCYKQHASDSRCCSPGANFLKPCFP